MDPITLKPAEPVTPVTDSILALQGIIQPILLLRIRLKTGLLSAALLAFAAAFLFIGDDCLFV